MQCQRSLTIKLGEAQTLPLTHTIVSIFLNHAQSDNTSTLPVNQEGNDTLDEVWDNESSPGFLGSHCWLWILMHTQQLCTVFSYAFCFFWPKVH